MTISQGFSRFASFTARQAGRPTAFAVALLLIAIWLATGPFFDFGDTWQLYINTATTVITFLMVFLIQATQNRDTEAIHIKLDELIRVTAGAQNSLVEIEKLDEETIARVQKHFEALARRARNPNRKDLSDPAFARAIVASLAASGEGEKKRAR